MIPTVDFYGSNITRLILGDNPFTGHSYINHVHSGDEMMDYYTADKCVRALFCAEENGINAYLALASQFILRVIRQYKNEGGKMHILFQSYPATPLDTNIREMLACKPTAIYHQGGSFDYLVEQGKTDEIKSRLKMIRESGVLTGFGTHEPETVMRAESEGWDVDFYVTCLYNARKEQRGQQSGFITGKTKELVFYPGDPPLMFDAIQSVKKPCIAFKLFAGGQIFLDKSEDKKREAAERAIADAYANIKPNDVACIGVFQKYTDQIRENTDTVKRLLGEA